MNSVIQNPYFLVFTFIIICILLFDLLVLGKNKHIISLKESLIWTSIWFALSIFFFLFISKYGHKIHNINNIHELNSYFSLYYPNQIVDHLNYSELLSLFRKNISTDYLTGYFLEYSLSIDNLFVILMILTAFSVRLENYKTVLFWGILGAILLRFIFIFLGASLVSKYNWILYIFGAFLLYSGIKLFIDRNKKNNVEIKDHFLVKFLAKYFKIYPDYYKHKFWLVDKNTFYITPLLVVLIIIEFSDLIFAFDSIPAIFSITRDPYIIYFSNIFAILGLRSLFFLLIKLLDYFHFLKVGVSILLVFVGLKLLIHSYLDKIGFTNLYSLMIILLTLTISIIASITFPQKEEQ